MSWLVALISQFTPNEKYQPRVDMLARLFADVDAAVMAAAVEAYIMNAAHAYFPTVGELRPFVQAAQFNRDRGEKVVRATWQIAAMSESERNALDDEIYRFEQQRGTMRPLADIEREIRAARQQLAAPVMPVLAKE